MSTTAAVAPLTVRLEEKEDQIQSLKSRLAGIRAHVEGQASKVQTLAVAVGASFAFGNLKRQAGAAGLATIGGMDPALVWGSVLYFAAPLAGGQAAEVGQAAGLGILCAFGYEKGQQPSR